MPPTVRFVQSRRLPDRLDHRRLSNAAANPALRLATIVVSLAYTSLRFGSVAAVNNKGNMTPDSIISLKRSLFTCVLLALGRLAPRRGRSEQCASLDRKLKPLQSWL